MSAEQLILVDGSALVYRAFYALPERLSTSAGMQTNAIYGFTTALRKAMSWKNPSHGAVVFDAPGRSFRHDIDPDYKAQRPKTPRELSAQFPWIRRVASAHGFPVIQVPDVEADDVIGTLARQAEARGMRVMIISGDKDFCQLVSPLVTLLEPLRDVTMDEEWVRKRWGVEPHQFASLLALMGDSIDNIPGVTGIGAKGAAKLLSRYDDLPAILDDVDAITGRAGSSLREQAETARRSYRLARIHTELTLDTAIDDLVLPEVDPEQMTALLQELEFFSLLDTPAPLSDTETTTRLLRTEEEARAFLDAAEAPLWGVTVLTDGVSAVRGQTLGIAIAGTRTAWLDLREPNPATAVVGEWLADPSASKVLCTVRDALSALHRVDLDVAGVDADISLASFLLDPTGHMPHGHAQVARMALGRPVGDIASLRPRGGTLADVSAQDLAAAAGQMALEVVQSWEALEPRVRDEDLYDLLVEHELPMSWVLAAMQDVGIGVDADRLRALQQEFTRRRDASESALHEHAGHPFNPGSTKQLGEVLFDELALPVIKRTKTGYSTDASVLERLRHEHPIAEELLRWRALAKLVNTYTQVLLDAVDDNGRVHTTLTQTHSVSGRLICTEPDLQRTPIRTEDGRRIREAFVPRDGWVMLSADYSQIELRLLAHMSTDPALVEAFAEGRDVHAATAARIYDVAIDAVTREQRRVGKTVNFATLYGQGATSLAEQLGLTRADAKSMIERYFERFAGVRTWIDEVVQRTRETGYCETLLGRRRQVRELTSRNPQTRSYGERIAANTPIQGSAADLCKRAMLRIDEALVRDGFEARMVLQIHDELLFEAPPGEVDALAARVRELMEGVYPLRVPLVVDVGTGPDWLAAHS